MYVVMYVCIYLSVYIYIYLDIYVSVYIYIYIHISRASGRHLCIALRRLPLDQNVLHSGVDGWNGSIRPWMRLRI